MDDDDDLKNWQRAPWLRWVAGTGWMIYVAMLVIVGILFLIRSFFNPMLIGPAP